MNILVTGASGVIGSALREYLPQATFLTRRDCDVRDAAATRNAIWLHDPEVVIHAAALTDHAHPNAAEIIETNIFGTEHVARACRACDARMVYLSTHYVYPGDTGRYRELDTPRPIGAYAWSKLAGERWAETVPNRLIVRGSWYTRETRLDKWAQRGALTDAWCSREPARSAARKIAALTFAACVGTVNIGGPRRTFAQILEEEGYEDFPRTERADFDYSQPNVLYRFPADTSVNTAKFDALRLRYPE